VNTYGLKTPGHEHADEGEGPTRGMAITRKEEISGSAVKGNKHENVWSGGLIID
jgi:hypothetical protein